MSLTVGARPFFMGLRRATRKNHRDLDRGLTLVVQVIGVYKLEAVTKFRLKSWTTGADAASRLSTCRSTNRDASLSSSFSATLARGAAALFIVGRRRPSLLRGGRMAACGPRDCIYNYPKRLAQDSPRGNAQRQLSEGLRMEDETVVRAASTSISRATSGCTTAVTPTRPRRGARRANSSISS